MIEETIIFNAAVKLMAALIQSGHTNAYSDVSRESWNKYCIEKAKALYKEATKS